MTGDRKDKAGEGVVLGKRDKEQYWGGGGGTVLGRSCHRRATWYRERTSAAWTSENAFFISVSCLSSSAGGVTKTHTHGEE